MQLTDKTVLVVGASSGIGRCVALQLGAMGNRVVVVARRKNLLEGLAGEVQAAGGVCVPMEADALKPEDMEQAAKHIIHGIEKEKRDYLFPLPMRWLIRLGRVLPKPVVGLLASRTMADEY